MILVDTCAITRATHDAPITFAVNTHQHGDHTYGNSLLPDSTVIIGHENTRAGCCTTRSSTACPPFWDPVPDWGSVTRRPPVLTTRTSLTLHCGHHRIELHHPGYAAHTSGDLVVWLPEQRVLFAGDLLFHQVTPLVFMGSIDGALRALDWIAQFQFEPARVIPGHGPLIDADTLPGVLDTHRHYYRLVLAAAQAGLREGLTPLAAARRCRLDTFADRPDAERIALNIHRAYADHSGTDLDLNQAFSDTIAFNGGPMHTAV